MYLLCMSGFCCRAVTVYTVTSYLGTDGCSANVCVTLADKGRLSNLGVCSCMGTPLTHVLVVNPFFRETTLEPSMFSINNFFLQSTYTGPSASYNPEPVIWRAAV